LELTAALHPGDGLGIRLVEGLSSPTRGTIKFNCIEEGVMRVRRGSRSRGRHVGAALLLGGLSLVAIVAGGRPASAEYGTPAGYPQCPHGYDAYTYASDICYFDKAAYQVTAYNTYFHSGASFSQWQTKVKATMYTGAPCGKSYLEAGEINDWTSGTQKNAGYIEVKVNGGQPTRTFYGNINTATIYWYGGTDIFGATFDNPPNPGKDVYQYHLVYQQGCTEEAGQFVWQSVANVINLNAFSGQTGFTVGLVGGGFVGSYNEYIIDNPCGQPGFNYQDCMNGGFTGSGNTGWNASQD
jgi:hypothetical protein